MVSKEKQKLAGALYSAINNIGMSNTETARKLDMSTSALSKMINHPEECNATTMKRVLSELEDIVVQMKDLAFNCHGSFNNYMEAKDE